MGAFLNHSSLLSLPCRFSCGRQTRSAYCLPIRKNTDCILSANPKKNKKKKHGLHIVGHSEKKNTVCILSATLKKTRSAYCRPVLKNMVCILSANPEKDGLHIRVGQSGKNTVCIFMSANPEKHGLIIVGQTWKNTVCILSSNPEKHGLHIVFQSGKTRSSYCRPIRRGWYARGMW